MRGVQQALRVDQAVSAGQHATGAEMADMAGLLQGLLEPVLGTGRWRLAACLRLGTCADLALRVQQQDVVIHRVLGSVALEVGLQVRLQRCLPCAQTAGRHVGQATVIAIAIVKPGHGLAEHGIGGEKADIGRALVQASHQQVDGMGGLHAQLGHGLLSGLRQLRLQQALLQLLQSLARVGEHGHQGLPLLRGLHAGRGFDEPPHEPYFAQVGGVAVEFPQVGKNQVGWQGCGHGALRSQVQAG